MTFYSFYWINCFYLLPVVIGLMYVGYRLKSRRLNLFINSKLWKEVVPSLSYDRRFWRKFLWILALCFLVFSLMRPQYGAKFEKISRRGHDIFIALDVSKSMMVQDIKPTRLSFAKQEVLSLINSLKGDRVGLIVFSGDAFVQSPLTVDYSAIQLFLDDIQSGSVPVPGTDIATAIKTARLAFRNATQKSTKVLIIISDGESFENDPIESAKVAAKEGIKIFTVGLGSDTGEPIPVYGENNKLMGYKKDKSNTIILSKLNSSLLKRISDIGNGVYYGVEKRYGVMDLIYKELSSFERKQLEEKMKKSFQDQYQWFLAITFLCLLFEMIIPERNGVKSK